MLLTYVIAKEPNLFGIETGIANAPPLSISKFSSLYEVMVHLSLLLTLHGCGVDGELCRTTVSVDFQVICRQKFLHVVISVQTPFINLRIKASRAPPAGGGGMYM